MGLLLLVDLDGVVYRGADPVPGVAAVLADRAARGDDVVYVTNNSMHYRADYLTRLAAMGAPVTPDTVVSSARATALYLARPRARASGACWSSAASGLERELRDVGLRRRDRRRMPRRGCSQEGIDGFAAAGAPDAVVVGLDPNLTYAAARGRGRLHPGRRPFHRHEPRPGLPDRARPAARCRARIVVALEAATGRRCRCRSASPRRTCSRRRRTPSVASRARRS